MSERRTSRRAGRLAAHFRGTDEDLGPPMCEACESIEAGQLLLPLVFTPDVDRNFWNRLREQARAAVAPLTPVRR